MDNKEIVDVSKKNLSKSKENAQKELKYQINDIPTIDVDKAYLCCEGVNAIVNKMIKQNKIVYKDRKTFVLKKETGQFFGKYKEFFFKTYSVGKSTWKFYHIFIVDENDLISVSNYKGNRFNIITLIDNNFEVKLLKKDSQLYKELKEAKDEIEMLKKNSSIR